MKRVGRAMSFRRGAGLFAWRDGGREGGREGGKGGEIKWSETEGGREGGKEGVP